MLLYKRAEIHKQKFIIMELKKMPFCMAKKHLSNEETSNVVSLIYESQQKFRNFL